LYVHTPGNVDVYSLPDYQYKESLTVPGAGAAFGGDDKIYTPINNTLLRRYSKIAILDRKNLSVPGHGYAYVQVSDYPRTGWHTVTINSQIKQNTVLKNRPIYSGKMYVCASDISGNVLPPFNKCQKSSPLNVVFGDSGATLENDGKLNEVVVGKYASIVLELDSKSQYLSPLVEGIGVEYIRNYQGSAVTSSRRISSINKFGSQVIISGTGFGASKGTVKLNGQIVSKTIRGWSDRQIILNVSNLSSIRGKWEIAKPDGTTITYQKN
jgi:hypothetical protein